MGENLRGFIERHYVTLCGKCQKQGFFLVFLGSSSNIEPFQMIQEKPCARCT